MAATSAPAVSDGKSVQARILCVTSGLAGMLYSSVELARRLAAAGHRLTYASFPDARRLVEHHGLDFLPLDPSRYEDFLEADAGTSALHQLLNLRDRRQRAVGLDGGRRLCPTRSVQSRSGSDPHRRRDARAHHRRHRQTGVPMALLNTFASIWRRPGLPPAHCPVTSRRRLERHATRHRDAVACAATQEVGVSHRPSKLRRFGCDRLSLLRPPGPHGRF